MNFFKRLFQSNESHSELDPALTNNGFFLSKQHMSWVLSGIILICFFIFIAGYFMGQQKAIEQFSTSVDQESLADKIYSSLYSVYDNKGITTAQDQESGEAGAETTEETAQEDNQSPKLTELNQPAAQQFYAELAGFGAHKNATIFANKLQNKGIAANVRTRYSRTVRGKKIAWYQVITDNHTSQEQLELLVARLKQEERLKDVHIVTC